MASSHHGDQARHEELMKQFLGQAEKPFRRKYPKGRLGADDDGELAFAVAADPQTGTVRIDFNKPVSWLGLYPSDVAALVNLLVAKAREVSTEPMTINLGD